MRGIKYAARDLFNMVSELEDM